MEYIIEEIFRIIAPRVIAFDRLSDAIDSGKAKWVSMNSLFEYTIQNNTTDAIRQILKNYFSTMSKEGHVPSRYKTFFSLQGENLLAFSRDDHSGDIRLDYTRITDKKYDWDAVKTLRNSMSSSVLDKVDDDTTPESDKNTLPDLVNVCV